MNGRQDPEAAIQRELVKWLRINHPEVEIRYNKNENKRDMLQAIIDKKMGQAKAGTPDLTLLKECSDWTYIFEPELKTLKGKLNPAQKEWHAKFKPTANRKTIVVYGYAQALEAVQSWLSQLPVATISQPTE